MAETVEILQQHLPKALADTFYMVAVATIIGVIVGGLIGLLLFLASNVLFHQNILLHKTVGFIVNAIRSLPFLILLVTLIPFLAAILGDPYTPTGAAISLSIAAIPFFARVAEGAFVEVDPGILEASVAQGATTKQIILGVIIPESLPGLIRGLVLTVISLLGYSAMVGTIGAGGIGDLAIQYGYYRYETLVLVVIILLLVVVVQLIQWGGDRLAQHFTR